MNHDPHPPHSVHDGPTPELAEVALVLAGGLAGAALGGWLMSAVAGVLLYIPVIPGAVVGYTVRRVRRSEHVALSVLAALFGFAGMVFGDALLFDLVDRPGTWNYITHFWEAAAGNPVKVLFWLINAAIAYWWSRPLAEVDLQALPAIVACRTCGHHNPATAKFCAECGTRRE